MFNRRSDTKPPAKHAGGLDLRLSAEFLLSVILLADRKNVVDQPVEYQAG
jgi:hypothetical protein